MLFGVTSTNPRLRPHSGPMTRGRALALLGVVVAVACGPRRVVAPAGNEPDLVVLLTEPETAAVGRASVSNQFGTTDLDGDRAATRVTAGQAPTPATILDASEVSGIFGEALSSLPMAPQSFVLYFRLESDELTDASRLLLPEVMRAIAARAAPDFVVVGHTDTTGYRNPTLHWDSIVRTRFGISWSARDSTRRSSRSGRTAKPTL